MRSTARTQPRYLQWTTGSRSTTYLKKPLAGHPTQNQAQSCDIADILRGHWQCLCFMLHEELSLSLRHRATSPAPFSHRNRST
eukprot:3482882-Amphidinium_carterae.2